MNGWDSDGYGKYEFKDFCKVNGLRHLNIMAYTLKQSEITDRINRALM